MSDDEDGVNTANVIIAPSLLGVLLILAVALTIWAFIKWRGSFKDARTFYSIVTELAPNVAFADLNGGNANTYEDVVSIFGADVNRGQIKDKNNPSMTVDVSVPDYMKLRLGHEIVYGGPPSNKIHYEDAPLRYAEVQKAISQDKALVSSMGDEGARVRRLAHEVTGSEDF